MAKTIAIIVPENNSTIDASVYSTINVRLKTDLDSSISKCYYHVYIDDVDKSWGTYTISKGITYYDFICTNKKYSDLSDGLHTMRAELSRQQDGSSPIVVSESITFNVIKSGITPDVTVAASKTGYIGITNKARKITKIYIGVGDIARKVKKSYIGVNGRARLWFNSSIASSKVYGIYWDGTANSKWTRTDDAAKFMDPVPYVAGATRYGSPFDNIYPWSEIKRYSDPTGNELVAIPKFYFRWMQSGNSLRLQITDLPTEGFYTSPAHMDRGDGKGERDVVYVGRYHSVNISTTSSSQINAKSASGKVSIAADYNHSRSYASKNGEGFYMFDFAMLCTIQMLYLVEFADWNSQKVIGYGCGTSLSSESQHTGTTDSMPYHTGTIHSNRDTEGGGIQYRWIENLWATDYDWVDGTWYNNSGDFSIGLNPNNYPDRSDYVRLFRDEERSGYITSMIVSPTKGFEWVIHPGKVENGSDSTYITDSTKRYLGDYGPSSDPEYYRIMYFGGSGSGGKDGLFHTSTCDYDDYYSNTTFRIQKLP